MKLEQRLYRVGGGHGFKRATENILNKDKKEVGKSLIEKIKTLLKNKKKEKIYSEAFEDGVNYAIEKMFNEEEEKKPSKTPYVIGGTAASVLGGSLGAGIGGTAGAIKEMKKAAKEAGIKADIKDLFTGATAEKIGEIVSDNPRALTRVAGKTALGGALGLGAAVGGTMALYNRAKKKMNKKDGK